MASAVRKLTGVGGDIRKIARLLQKEAPPGHMLAYINQEEADLLKARGGSGKPHADTGVPSFEDGTEIFDYGQPTGYQGPDYSPGAAEPFDKQAYNRAAESEISMGESGPGQSFAPVTADVPANNAAADFVGRPYEGPPLDLNVGTGTPVSSAAAPVSAEGRVPYIPTPRETGNYPGGSVLTGAKNVGGEPGFFDNMSDQTKARLGIGGAQSLIGAYQISQATEQAKKYREDMAKLAQPYQTEGKKLIAQAQSGELTPAAQQQLQAAQAQAAQGAEKRGGVGAQQAQMAVENMRQQLLQNQYDYGLKITGIGDSIATGAIRTGMDADRYVNQLASNYVNNIARTLSNAPTYVTSYSQNT